MLDQDGTPSVELDCVAVVVQTDTKGDLIYKVVRVDGSMKLTTKTQMALS